MSRKPTLIVFTLLICLFLNASVAAQQAFLRKGTVALDPDDKRTLFLYVPGYTLLYDLGEIERIGSTTFGTREAYQFATTQDGIRVLVRVADVRKKQKDIEALEKYDFLVNRRMPFCETAEACDDVWSDFTTDTDEGRNWVAVWPRVAGKFTALEEKNSRAVSLTIGGDWDSGFIPSKRSRLKLEDSGFITLLNRHYPAYRLIEETNQELASPCTHERYQTNRVSLLNKVEAYAKASVNAQFDAAEGLSKAIPKNFAKALLSFLGLEASISAEAFVDGNWKKEDNEETGRHIIYGDRDQEWQVKTVEIHRRSDDGPKIYRPFGSAVIRKVLKCEAGQPTEMAFASYFLAFFPEENGESPTPIIINLNADRIENLRLTNNPLDRGLVSINTQGSHYKLLDFFVGHNVPKSIANLFIKEINVAEAR